MKKIILLLMLSATVFACKNSEEKNKESDEMTIETPENTKTYKGEFLDSNGAMVFMGPSFIYGVKRDVTSEELSKRVGPIKKNESDMVGVMVKGVVSKNTSPDTEWEEMITITEIMMVDNKPSEADIKFDEKENKS